MGFYFFGGRHNHSFRLGSAPNQNFLLVDHFQEVFLETVPALSAGFLFIGLDKFSILTTIVVEMNTINTNEKIIKNCKHRGILIKVGY